MADSWSAWRVVPSNWRSLRLNVLRRDGFRCACGASAQEVDHILPVAEGGTHELENLVAICAGCHTRKTHEEQQRGRERRQARRAPRREPHPGRIQRDDP
jgi:5-methylcytosine-specific restriction enzyme A